MIAKEFDDNKLSDTHFTKFNTNWLNFLSPKFDMAAKRHKKHKNKISWLVISMAYNE
jgi:hypothetical protein